MHRRESNIPSGPIRGLSTSNARTTHSNGNNSKRPQRERTLPPSIETVTNACKKIKLVNSQVEQANMDHRAVILKRHHIDLNNQMECETIEASPATKRKKITWP